MNVLTLGDGRTLAFRQKGGGNPLVLLHGWAMSSAVFDEMAELLSERYHVVIPDLKGHGQSEGGEGFGLDDFTADLEELFQFLELENAALLGWSLGGQVAIRLKRRLSDRISSLALVSSTPCFVSSGNWDAGLPPGQVQAMQRNLRGNYVKAMGEFFDLQFFGEDLDSSRYRHIIEFAGRKGTLPSPDVAAAALKTLRTADLREDLPQIACPTLVIHGELDRICPASAGRHLAESIPGAILEILPTVGHAPFLSQPQSVADLLRAFIP